jgi:beta,beta-carotene 9',10'-dioxygenase
MSHTNPCSDIGGSASSATFRNPFLHSAPEREFLEAVVTGALPPWLRGALVRTAPAVFHHGTFDARHWFDGLGLIFAFRFLADGRVRFQQHLLESEAAKRIASGRDDTPHFGTPMHRRLCERLLSPLPRRNDNANVAIRQMGTTLVAMTETSVQIEVDGDTLRAVGPVRYEDDLGRDLLMLAHPHADFSRNLLVNVGTELSVRPGLVVYEHSLGERRRRPLARVPFAKVPYVHSFGLTPEHAVLVCGPLVVRPWTLLWSDKAYIDHFSWRPELGTTLARVNRSSGAVSLHHAPPMFVFHTINAFERGSETVVDVLAYEDAAIVRRLGTDALARSLPDFGPRPRRIVLRDGTDEARVEPLHDVAFEFPVIDYRRFSGQKYRVAFGTAYASGTDGYEASVLRVDLDGTSVRRFASRGWIFGEPVCVSRPGATREGEGAILSVAGHLNGARSAVVVLDAETLDPLAWAEVDVAIPLGFHGTFVREPRS